MPAPSLTRMLLATLVPLLALAAAPATKPSAAEKPTIEFADGGVAMPVPDGWDVQLLSDDALGAMLVARAGTFGPTGAGLTVGLSPQQHSMTDNPKIADAIGKSILDQLRRMVEAQGLEVLTAPHLERDPEWFIRIRDVTRDPTSGKVADRLHVYRPVGVYLVMVAVTAYDPPTPDDAKAVHKVGETALYQIRPAKAQRNAGVATKGQPTALGKAKLKLAPPKGWMEVRTDADDGTVVTYRKPLGSTVVAVRVAALDKQPDAKDAAAERIAREELAKYIPSGTEPAGEPEVVQGGAFVVKLKQAAKRFSQRHRVETRVATVGDPAAGMRLVAVTNASTELSADEASKFADELAGTAELFKPR